MYASTSSFVKHDSCERCGSRDNVAWYSNGTGFCFGCGVFYSSQYGGLQRPAEASRNERERAESGGRSGSVIGETPNEKLCSSDVLFRPPPSDIGTYYPIVVVDWMAKYHISVTDMLRFNVKWSPGREQLVYLFYGADKDLVLWQARNFKQGTSHKDRFFTSGSPEKVIASYSSQQGDNKTAVIVEDCASAIKIAKSGYTGIPVFSAKMSPAKMTRVCNMFEDIIWWLDDDKFVEAAKQSNLCKLLGVTSRVVHTAYDPKEYSTTEVKELLDI
jgi:hypothetical protein